MKAYDIRVVILSTDKGYKLPLVNGLSRDIRFEVISSSLEIAQIKPLLSKNKPNVLILDTMKQKLEASFLKSLIDEFNIKIIVIGAVANINFLQIGINDIMHKPVANNELVWNVYIRDITKRIERFYLNAPAVSFDSRIGSVNASDKIILVASSTGGTEALPDLVSKLPVDIPPVLIVQHMPSVFTRQFADRLDRISKIKVKEAVNGEYLKTGTALVAPGDLHMRLIKKVSRLAVEVFFGEKVHGVRPAADILFDSAVSIANPANITGVILTGMGSDGAKGLYELKRNGAKVIAQDRETSVVYGMPKAAYELGAVDYILPIGKISDKIIELNK